MNFSMYMFPFISSLLFAATTTTAQMLNATAISAVDGASVLECWQFSAAASSFAGATNYPIGDFQGAYIGVIAPKTYIGQAWAPHVQYSLVMSGLVHITLPNSKHEAWVQGGKYGIIIAADTKNVSKTGHITEFPGGGDTVIAQFAFTDGKAPEHTVLYEGPCLLEQLIAM